MSEKLRNEYKETLIRFTADANFLDNFSFNTGRDPEQSYQYKKMIENIKKLSELEQQMLDLKIEYQDIIKEVEKIYGK